MTRRRPHVEFYAAIYVIGVLIGLLAGGCAQSPQIQYVQARRTLSHVERHIRQQTEAGKVSEEAALFSEPAIKAARAAVADGKARLDEGDTRGLKADLRMFWAIVARLTQDYLIPPLPPQPVEQP